MVIDLLKFELESDLKFKTKMLCEHLTTKKHFLYELFCVNRWQAIVSTKNKVYILKIVSIHALLKETEKRKKHSYAKKIHLAHPVYPQAQDLEFTVVV